MDSPTVSIVVPAFNEERNIPTFLKTMIPVLESTGETFEVVFINDGSRDGTLGALVAAASQDPRVKVVSLARNFGKDVALSAGLAHATGQAVIPIDCDLQHPPELVPPMIAKWREGFEMVVGVRARRDEESWARRSASKLYYRVVRWTTDVDIPANAGDFRLLDRKIVDVINQMPERCRFMKGIFAWPGFRTAFIEFQAAQRDHGASRWSFFKLWRFALDGIFSFSTAPLKVWTYVGLATAAASFLYLVATLVQVAFFGRDVPGYASLLILLLFFNGLAMISNGIQGEYLARIFEEVKGRPLYVVGGLWGFDQARIAPAVDASARPPVGLPRPRPLETARQDRRA